MVLIDKTRLDYALAIGSPLPAFSLPGTDGKTYTDRGFSKSILVVLFWCNHCPYVHAAESRIVEIARKFSTAADFVAISSNDASQYPDDSFEEMGKKKYPFPYLYDATQQTARAFGAECTPHCFIFKDGKLAYQGRVDDAGRDSLRATRSELLEALVALSQGRAPPLPLTSAMGCSIKWH